MKTLYSVIAETGNTCNVLGVFPSLKDANNFIDYCQNWRERFEKYFGIAYKDVTSFTDDMIDWFNSNHNDLDCSLFTQETKFYENFNGN